MRRAAWPRTPDRATPRPGAACAGGATPPRQAVTITAARNRGRWERETMAARELPVHANKPRSEDPLLLHAPGLQLVGLGHALLPVGVAFAAGPPLAHLGKPILRMVAPARRGGLERGGNWLSSGLWYFLFAVESTIQVSGQGAHPVGDTPTLDAAAHAAATPRRARMHATLPGTPQIRAPRIAAGVLTWCSGTWGI